MGRLFLSTFIAMLLLSLAFADFRLEKIDVTIKDVQKDGRAHVTESIKFFVIGDYENSLYDSGFNKNDLSFWATTTGLKDVKLHINPNKVDIRGFRITPRPKNNCNPLSGLCHGELVIDYLTYPYFDNLTSRNVEGTGMFEITKEKPRTTKYSLNPNSLSFTTSPQGDILLDRLTYLNVVLPAGANLIDATPTPEITALKGGMQSFSLTNTVLVKLSLVFEVEESLDKEVGEFFSDFLGAIREEITGEHGIAILIIAAIFLGTYVYLQSLKKKQ